MLTSPREDERQEETLRMDPFLQDDRLYSKTPYFDLLKFTKIIIRT